MPIQYVLEIFQKIFQMIKQTGLNGHACDFSVNFASIDFGDTIDIHKYLMKKHDIK